MPQTKDYNATHDVVLNGHMTYEGETLPEGTIAEHSKEITGATFFVGNYTEYGVMSYTKVNVSRSFILDLAEQIKALEASKCMMPVERDLPF